MKVYTNPQIFANMKKIIQIILFSLIGTTVYSQNIVSFGSFPVFENEKKSLLTADLLNKLNWGSIKSYSWDGHYIRENIDSFITTYEYFKQGGSSFFKIRSFSGFVLQFESEVSTLYNISKSSYFDKTVWLSYVNKLMPNLSDEFKLMHNETKEVLRAYYQLLGVDTRDEYGWYCEYSAVGRPTAKRLAVIELIRYHRTDLLKRLLSYQNIQTQLYAADALIYLNGETKNKIIAEKRKLKENQNRLDSLQSDIEKDYIQGIRESIKLSKGLIKYLEADLLVKADWKVIYELRDSNKEVKTCRDGTGSYKIYSNKTSDILSEQAISQIPSQYERFKTCDFFR
jgi:hypothetical protein